MKINKYKIVKWYNKETLQINYGIDIKLDGEWFHLKHGEKAFFDTLEEAFEIKRFHEKEEKDTKHV